MTSPNFLYGSPGGITPVQFAPGEDASITGSAEAYGVTAGGDATQNTILLNRALRENSRVSITRPGRYAFNGSQSPFAAIFVPSNTDFSFGPGVELFLADGSNVALIANEHAFNNGVVIGATFMTHSSGVITINQTGIGNSFAVGDWVTVDFVATKGYQGVFQTATSSPNTITFATASGNLVSASPAVVMPITGPFWNGTALVNQAVSMVIRPANNNIRIHGGGIFNANGIGQTSNASGDPRGLGMYLRGCANSEIYRLHTRRARCWTIALNNTLNVNVHHIIAENGIGGNGYGANANDVVHQTGENRNAVVENIYALSIFDNVVGSTLDYVDNITGFLPFGWQTPGDNWDSVIRYIGLRNGLQPIVTKWGNTLFRFGGTHIVDNIRGSSGSAFQMANYANTSMYNCNGDVLKLSNIGGSSNSSAVTLTTNGVWDLIEVDTVRAVRALPAIVQVYLAAGGTPSSVGIKQLKAGRFFYTNAFEGANRTGPSVSVGGTLAGTCNIGYLDVSDVEESPLASGAALIEIGYDPVTPTTVANIKRISLNNVSAVGSGVGSLIDVALASTVGEITLTASRFTSSASAGSLVRLGASVTAGTQVSFGAGCSAPGAERFLVSTAAIGRLNGANAQFDPGAAGANITAPIPGDVFYNTNASFGVPGVGVYMRGAAGWVRIAA